MDEWLRSAFKVIPNGWNTGAGTEDAFTFTAGGQGITAPISWFASTFGAVSTPPTCAALQAVDPTNKAGWNGFFAAWKTAGIIA